MRINLYDDGSWTEDDGWRETNPVFLRDSIDADREPFLWITDKGKALEVSEMATPHLINALNMIWRNVFGIKEDRPEIMGKWSSAYVDAACKAMSIELQRRVEEA